MRPLLDGLPQFLDLRLHAGDMLPELVRFLHIPSLPVVRAVDGSLGMSRSILSIGGVTAQLPISRVFADSGSKAAINNPISASKHKIFRMLESKLSEAVLCQTYPAIESP